MIGKLRRRFILIAMLSVAAVMTVLVASINLISYISTMKSIDRTLTMITDNRGAVPEFREPGHRGERRDPGFTPETPFSTRYFVVRYDETGALVGSDLRHIAAVTEDDISDYIAIALEKGVGYGSSSPYRYYAAQAEDGVHMAVFLDCHREMRSVRVFAVGSVAAGLVCIALVYGLILLFSKKAIDPTVRSIEKQKQFITDASHELKTPLTVIITSLRVLELETGQSKWIDKAQAQAGSMTELINQLVTLSRMDEETPALSITDFSLSDAVTETAESFADMAAARGRSFTVDAEQEVFLRGDQRAVRQLVSVLADNAVKYSTDGGRIALTLRKRPRGAVLVCRNTCEGLDQSELSRLFDRFYRVDESRSRQTGGFGIGLAIARSVAEAHGGSIRAECPDEHTIEFTAELRNMKGRYENK